MPLETGNKISDLNSLWPLGSDPKSQGDDHIRLIKSILQADAPSLAEGGAFVTAPTVPDGATGKQVPNADDIPALAGTGPVDIVEANATAGWQVWGDTLIQWGQSTGSGSGVDNVTFVQPFKVAPQISVGMISVVPENRAVGLVNVTETSFDAYVVTAAGVFTAMVFQWVAIGEAPDNLKKPKTVQTIGGTELQEYHDPAGVASWRIVGNTLECWGLHPGNSSGDVTVFYPKSFARPPNLTGVAVTSDPSIVNVSRNGGNTTQGVFRVMRIDTQANWNSAVEWHAIGEWDGN